MSDFYAQKIQKEAVLLANAVLSGNSRLVPYIAAHRPEDVTININGNCGGFGAICRENGKYRAKGAMEYFNKASLEYLYQILVGVIRSKSRCIGNNSDISKSNQELIAREIRYSKS